jgi:hypothetical protein
MEIPVDPSGVPDVFGIKFQGTFDDLAKQDLADWISQSTFAPARRNGAAVAGVMKITFQ